MLPESVFILRHALSDMNVVNKREKGALPPDTPTTDDPATLRRTHDLLHKLSPIGIEQARRANSAMHSILPEGFDRVWTSAAVRAQMTTALILQGYPQQNIVIERRIVERSWGLYGQMSRAEAAEAFPLTTAHRQSPAAFHTRLDGGESLADAQIRAETFLRTLHHANEHNGFSRVLVSAHGEFNTLLIESITGVNIKMGNCDLIHLRREGRKIAKFQHFELAEGQTEAPWQEVPPRRTFSADELLTQFDLT